jgi:hypothetical protein
MFYYDDFIDEFYIYFGKISEFNNKYYTCIDQGNTNYLKTVYNFTIPAY